jgi:hypothetical protein
MQLGRNDPCWCKSGKNYKKCHGRMIDVERAKKDSEEKRIEWQYHTVVYVDVLGQKKLLRSLNKPPQSEEDNRYLEIVRKTYGTVKMIRDCYSGYADWLQKRMLENHDKNTGVPIERYRQVSELGLRKERFSDTLTFYAPFKNSIGENVVMPIYVMLQAAALLLLASFSENIALRGGIEVGLAADWPEFGIYGYPLVAAYDLENDVAEYPRIVVGQNLVDYLKIMKDGDQSSYLGRLNAHFATQGLSLLWKDTDGRMIIDFLGKKSLEHSGDVFNDTIRKGYKFVHDEQKRFMEKNDDEAKKLSSRYTRLLKYFEMRMQENKIKP